MAAPRPVAFQAAPKKTMAADPMKIELLAPEPPPTDYTTPALLIVGLLVVGGGAYYFLRSTSD